jgi:hypothetical protein
MHTGTEFRIAGEGASVRVSISRYERAEFTAGADADWLVASIDIAADGFTAKVSGALRSEDTTERDIKIPVTVDSLRRIRLASLAA